MYCYLLKVHEYNLVLVGGSAKTVGPGGWTLGGGHSPITRMFGFGVDQVLRFSIVTANGNHIDVQDGSECGHYFQLMLVNYACGYNLLEFSWNYSS